MESGIEYCYSLVMLPKYIQVLLDNFSTLLLRKREIEFILFLVKQFCFELFVITCCLGGIYNSKW